MTDTKIDEKSALDEKPASTPQAETAKVITASMILFTSRSIACRRSSFGLPPSDTRSR